MLHYDFQGVIVVNGSPRKTEVSGNPLGRTVIRVDGKTVYDKKPFVHTGKITFQIFPGKNAEMHWEQVSATGMECDILLDGQKTTLPRITRDGNAVASVGPQGRAQFAKRVAGAGMALSVFVIALYNQGTLRNAYYFPSLLVLSPLFFVTGLAMFTRPDIDFNGKQHRTLGIVVTVFLVLAGFFYKSWFLHTFAPR